MDRRNERIEALIGKNGTEILKNANIILFGLGGVGSFTAEALARSFIGNITIVDFDIIDITNINRQIHANDNSISKLKVIEVQNRIESINPYCKVKAISTKLNKDNIKEFFDTKYDFVIDAIDDSLAKETLIQYCYRNKIKIISSMGLANRLDASKVQITKLKKTSACGLARKLRRKLKNIDIPVVSSTEHSIKHDKDFKGSVSFVPSIGGLLMASYIINKLLKNNNKSF